jgi:hypothetical protein
VRVLFLEPPQEVLDLLDRRRRWGADRWDEMWNGVLHVVPMPSGEMSRFGTEFPTTVAPLAKVDFYSERGVREMLAARPAERQVELLRAVGGRLMPVRPGPDGAVESECSGSPSAPSTASSRSPGTAARPPSERAAKPGCGPGIGWSA